METKTKTETEAYDQRRGARALVRFDITIPVRNTIYGKGEIAGFEPKLAARLVVPQKLSETLGVQVPAHYVDSQGNPADRPVLVYPPADRGCW